MKRSETIGSVTDWPTSANLDMPYEMAMIFLAHAVGDPPEGTRIDVVYRDHDLGSYPTLAVLWDELVCPFEPWKFINRCEDALSEFNDAVDWSRLHLSNFADEDKSEDED